MGVFLCLDLMHFWGFTTLYTPLQGGQKGTQRGTRFGLIDLRFSFQKSHRVVQCLEFMYLGQVKMRDFLQKLVFVE
jgi:hypothetical protein